MGAPELFILALWVTIVFLLPFGVLSQVAQSRGQTQKFVLWGLLGWIGLVIGLIGLLRRPRNEFGLSW